MLRMFDERPNLSASVLICMASSRVGASTSMVGPARASLRSAWMWSMPGSRKPHVLPEPVLAMATRSRPLSAMGQACAWMGVGDLKPAWRICGSARQERQRTAAHAHGTRQGTSAPQRAVTHIRTDAAQKVSRAQCMMHCGGLCESRVTRFSRTAAVLPTPS